MSNPMINFIDNIIESLEDLKAGMSASTETQEDMKKLSDALALPTILLMTEIQDKGLDIEAPSIGGKTLVLKNVD